MVLFCKYYKKDLTAETELSRVNETAKYTGQIRV